MAIPRKLILVVVLVVLLLATGGFVYWRFYASETPVVDSRPSTCPPQQFCPGTPKTCQPNSCDSPEIVRIPVPLGETNYLPWVEDDADTVIFMTAIKEATHVLEFGIGGSTYQANILPNIRKIWSVEGSQEFLDSLLEDYPSIKWSKLHERITFFIPSYGPLGVASNPIGETHKAEWPNYPNSIFKIPKEELKKVDFVYIDGRFRVACTLLALLHTDAKLFVIDNYMSRLERFQILEHKGFLKRVDHKVAMARFERIPDFDRDLALKLIEKYQYVPY